jgi:hypothetical protein
LAFISLSKRRRGRRGNGGSGSLDLATKDDWRTDHGRQPNIIARAVHLHAAKPKHAPENALIEVYRFYARQLQLARVPLEETGLIDETPIRDRYFGCHERYHVAHKDHYADNHHA